MLIPFLARIRAVSAARGRSLWIVFTSDHGEALGEHGATDHGDLLYDEGLRVPLWVIGPSPREARVDTPVSHVDLLPSLCELAGAPVPPGLPGRSWVPALRGEVLAARPVLAETRHSAFDNAMAVVGGFKVIHELRTTPRTMELRGRPSSGVPADIAWRKEWEAYDLAADPHELSWGAPLAVPGAAAALRALQAFDAERGAPPAPGTGQGLSPDVVQAMRELGYL